MSVDEIHFHIRVWLNRILFIKRESTLYIDHVTKVLVNTKDMENMRLLISKESQLALKRDELNQLKEYINSLEHKLSDYHKEHKFADNHNYVEVFWQIKLKINAFEKDYSKALEDIDYVLCKYIKIDKITV